MTSQQTLQIVKFSIVGASGALINFLVYFSLTNFLLVSFTKASTISFFIALLNNYLCNSVWTFKKHTKKSLKFSTTSLTKYLLSNLIALSINLSILELGVLTYGNGTHFLFQCLGMGLGGISNFMMSKYFVFTNITR